MVSFVFDWSSPVYMDEPNAQLAMLFGALEATSTSSRNYKLMLIFIYIIYNIDLCYYRFNFVLPKLKF